MTANLNNNNTFGFISDESGQPIITVCFGVELPLAKKQQIINAVLNELSTETLSFEDAKPMTWEQKKKEFTELVLQQENQQMMIIWYMENVLDLPVEEANKRYTLGENLKVLLKKTHEEVVDSVYCADYDFSMSPVKKVAERYTPNYNPDTTEYVLGVDVASSSPKITVTEIVVAPAKERQELAELEKLIMTARANNQGIDTDRITRYLELRKKYEQ